VAGCTRGAREQGEHFDDATRRISPEWGIGQVLSRGEDRIDVQFRHALVLLKVSVAAAFLERVSKAEAALAGADTPPRKEGSVKTPRASKKASKSSPEAAR